VTGSKPTRVLIAAADPLVRHALDNVLDEAGFEIVAETASAAEVADQVAKGHADVAVVDVMLEDGDGLATAERIARESPQTRVIVLSASEDDSKGIQALRAGASGYLRKDIELDALPRAIQGVMDGEAAISRKLTMSVLEELRRTPPVGPGLRPTVSELTPREWQVLDLLTTGASTADIAIDLVLSPETVLTHVKNILKKLGVHSRRDAIREAERLRTGTEEHAAAKTAPPPRTKRDGA
jgi:NarL family two-component system response regulator LiaR